MPRDRRHSYAPSGGTNRTEAIAIMDLQRITLVMPVCQADASILLNGASGLARRQGASLDMACLYVEPPASPAECFASGSAAIRSVLAHTDERIAQLLVPTRTAFLHVLQDAGLSGAWSAVEERDADDLFATSATPADLVILPAACRMSPRLAQIALLECRTPCLLVPQQWPGLCDRILIAWNGSDEARRSVEQALPLLRRAKAVRLAIVADGSASDPLDPDMAAWFEAQEVDYDICPHERGSDRDEAMIVRACADFAADLLVMGAYGHSRVGEAIFGGVTRFMLHHAPIATYLAR
jgi:nucleotide-binding universal stress UspA family protein